MMTLLSKNELLVTEIVSAPPLHLRIVRGMIIAALNEK